VLTYNGKKLPDNQVTGTLSIEMNQSFILLPDKPWNRRLYDARVAYFSFEQTNYSLDDHKAADRDISRVGAWNQAIPLPMPVASL
jgi:hypothetical protein